MTHPYTQILELLATARAIAETNGMTDVANSLCDEISEVRWLAEQDGIGIESPALARDRRNSMAGRLVLRHGAKRVPA